jgi:hypothetical protein
MARKKVMRKERRDEEMAGDQKLYLEQKSTTGVLISMVANPKKKFVPLF